MDTKTLWNNYKKDIKKCIDDLKHKETRKKQIANLFTASRLLSPFVLIPLSFLKLYLATIILTIIFALTDACDGYFARKYNAVSNFGKDLDAVVDKVFASTLLIAISSINIYLLILVVFEFIIGVINVIEKYQNHNPKTMIIGKFKTACLSFMIVLFLSSLYFDIPNVILVIIYILTLVLQIFTTLTYFNNYLKNTYNRKLKLIPNKKK